MQRSSDLNAYAAGRTRVAVTTGVLREFLARRLATDEMRAALIHELGHHAARASRFALITMWLALPWQAASRFAIGLGLGSSAFAPEHYPEEIVNYVNTRGADKIIYAGYHPVGLSLERIMAELPEVPIREQVWPKFLRENALRVLGLN